MLSAKGSLLACVPKPAGLVTSIKIFVPDTSLPAVFRCSPRETDQTAVTLAFLRQRHLNAPALLRHWQSQDRSYTLVEWAESISVEVAWPTISESSREKVAQNIQQ
jgi:hypothetical protein